MAKPRDGICLMDMHGEAARILAAWRDVERKLNQATFGSADAENWLMESAGLRAEYQRLTEQLGGVDQMDRTDQPVPTR